MRHFKADSYFFIGIAAGFILCCVVGYAISQHERFAHFNRFYSPIQPTMQYYPTAHELLQTATHLARHHNVLVLVGGNSVFKGLGQDPALLWTRVLQHQLGDHYVVLNYAIDAAAFNAFGGVAYRMLRERYQQVLFVTTCVPEIKGGTDQHQYQYVFWDAYYKKLFHPDITEKQAIKAQRLEDLKKRSGQELHLMSALDSLFYFRNLWNALSYHVGFTIWTDNSAQSFFKAKKKYPDVDVLSPSHRVDIQAMLNQKSTLENSLINPSWLAQSQITYRDEWPVQDRDHTLCMIPTFNPAMMTQLSPSTQLAFRGLLAQFADTLNTLGYHAVIFTDALTAADYVDARHLSTSGGIKLAMQVDQVIKEWH